MPFLDEASIQKFTPHYPELCRALREAFSIRGRGEAQITSKIGVKGPGGSFFHAMPAVFNDLAVIKWIASGSEPGDRYIHALLIATDTVSGAPIAILDFAWLTGVRTAAVSAVAAELLSNHEAKHLAVFGCGLQARTHLDALLSLRSLSHVTAVSRNLKTAEHFAEEVRKRGLAASAVDQPTQEFYEADIILSAAPLHIKPVLDAARTKPGTLIIAVDLADSWIPSSLTSMDLLVTDDLPHLRGMKESGSVIYGLPCQTDLPHLLTQETEQRWTADQRVAFIPPGLAFADAVVTRLVLSNANLYPVTRKDRAV